MTVERLDFSNLPPGYSKRLHRTGWSLDHDGKELGFYQARSAIADLAKAAWGHHKARHNPPGMWTGFDSILPDLVERTPRMGVYIPGLAHVELDAGRARFKSIEEAESAARVAAWKVYEDAVEVADLLDGENGPAETWPERCAWPRPLAWTAGQRAEVRLWRSWTSRPPFLPEVLRG